MQLTVIAQRLGRDHAFTCFLHAADVRHAAPLLWMRGEAHAASELRCLSYAVED
jgi:hypothetical protein